MGGCGLEGHPCRADERKSRREMSEPVGDGAVEIIRVHRPTYQKQKLVARLIWTVVSNVALLAASFEFLRRADAVLFTGSPPLMLHFIAPLNVLLRKRLSVVSGLSSRVSDRRAR